MSLSRIIFTQFIITYTRFTNGPLEVSSKKDDKVLFSPTQHHNPNNTIRTAVTIIFTANRHMFSPELPAENRWLEFYR